MPPLSAFTRYTSSFVGVTLLTSFAFQGILHKRVSTAEHSRLTAHKSILESLNQRLRSGEDVSEHEIVRLVRLARGGGEQADAVEDTPWREVILGKRIKESREQKEIDEWNAAITQESKPSPVPVVPLVSPTAAPSQVSAHPTNKTGFL